MANSVICPNTDAPCDTAQEYKEDFKKLTDDIEEIKSSLKSIVLRLDKDQMISITEPNGDLFQQPKEQFFQRLYFNDVDGAEKVKGLENRIDNIGSETFDKVADKSEKAMSVIKFIGWILFIISQMYLMLRIGTIAGTN